MVCWWVGIFLYFKGIKQSWIEEYECLTLKMKACFCNLIVDIAGLTIKFILPVT